MQNKANTMQNALNEIKQSIESAISSDGERGKHSLIRSQKPIQLIHNAIKQSFVKSGIKQDLINPVLKQTKNVVNQETEIFGLLKAKKQDLSIFPLNYEIKPEIIQEATYLFGKTRWPSLKTRRGSGKSASRRRSARTMTFESTPSASSKLPTKRATQEKWPPKQKPS
jgi:hypothetical protein